MFKNRILNPPHSYTHANIYIHAHTQAGTYTGVHMGRGHRYSSPRLPCLSRCCHQLPSLCPSCSSNLPISVLPSRSDTRRSLSETCVSRSVAHCYHLRLDCCKCFHLRGAIPTTPAYITFLIFFIVLITLRYFLIYLVLFIFPSSL